MNTTRTSQRKLDLLFIMDPMEKILFPYDTSFTLILEAQARGHRILYAEPRELRLTHHGLDVSARIVRADPKKGFHILGHVSLPVRRANCVFIRKDPPFNVEYLYMTYLLEAAAGQTLMINAPRGIRDFNEKLFPFRFKQWMPPSIVTSDADSILAFQRNIRSDLILKPLNRKGGEGITLLPLSSGRKKMILGAATSHGTKTILAQKFLRKGLTEGDKRIFLWKGELLGTFARVPKKGEFRANLSRGGTSRKTQVTARERKIIAAMKPFFMRHGLFFVGLDLVDGMVTEINVTSPAGLYEVMDLEGVVLERRIISSIERMCGKKR